MNNTDSNRKIGFYIRVSTERQAKVEEGSLKNQKQMLLAELNKRNLQNKDWGKLIEIYVDEGISGKDINRPAFQKMLKDIEIGKIDTIMFTELSRLSRSLKDFLNIFEFTQKYNCDLICLKTDIDTTSPYKNLITKILMVFGEFEREMTSQRTSINAYERSKRGLANGGFTLLGYKRDKNKKGYLHIDEKEAAIVREIFKTYIREKSIQKTMEAIKSKYEGLNSRLKKITKSRIYSILTNKAYIGIREIYKKDKSKYEEVKAVWKGIIDEKLFRRAENLLKANKERLHWRNSGRFNYLLSGLIMCGKCGEKLQGKCAYSRINKKHYYYSHKNTCKNGGLSGIDAEVTHKLVFDWLDEISNNGEKFNQLKTEGKIRIKRRIDFLNKAIYKLKTEKKALVNEIEARLNELTNTKSEIVKKTIEESIIKLDQAKKEIEDKHVYIKYEIERLEKLIQDDNNLFREYSDRIKTVFRPPTNKTKNKLKEVISYIKLDDRNVKIALSPVNLNEPVRALFGFSRSGTLEPNTNNNLIIGSILLPSKLLLRSKSYLLNLYLRQKLSKREIARQLNVSHSAVIEALRKAGIHGNISNENKRKGQIPFGYDYKDGKFIKNEREQEAIRLIKQLKANGLSLRGIARELNKNLIPTKNNGIWQANTIRNILNRNNHKKSI